MAYYGPRRFNWFTFVLIVVALGAGYWGWRFLPAYFDAWTVDHILREAGAATYRLNRVRNEAGKTAALNQLLEHVRADIQSKASVDDPDLAVNLDLDEDNAVLTADYTVEITHPYLRRTTRLHFHRVQTTDIKKVSWE